MSDLATVMIATRNRKEELRLTLESLRLQDWPSIEVIVADDASTDGTSDLVRSEFPEVVLLSLEVNVGSVSARNRIIERASGTVIIGLDDDSRFIETDSIRRVMERLEREADLGIIAFQPIGPEHPERMTPEGRMRGEWHCSSFAACGVAIRKSIFSHTGGFPDYFFHMYEEPDLVIRTWDCGYRALQWNEIVVYHAFTPVGRNEQRTHHRHARNEACSVIMRYPAALVVPGLLAKLLGQLRYAFRRGGSWVVRDPIIWWEILKRIPVAIANRRPVRASTIKTIVALNRSHVVSVEEALQLGRRSWKEVLQRPQAASTTTGGKQESVLQDSEFVR